MLRDAAYLEPSKLALCVLQSGREAAISLVLDEPKPGIELKRCIFLRSLEDTVPVVVVVRFMDDDSKVGETLSVLEELSEVLEEPVGLGVW